MFFLCVCVHVENRNATVKLCPFEQHYLAITHERFQTRFIPWHGSQDILCFSGQKNNTMTNVTLFFVTQGIDFHLIQ